MLMPSIEQQYKNTVLKGIKNWHLTSTVPYLQTAKIAVAVIFCASIIDRPSLLCHDCMVIQKEQFNKTANILPVM